jgi:lipopolysaccharide/colanic/teichoic acid biosynthesis glycosyltransferase
MTASFQIEQATNERHFSSWCFSRPKRAMDFTCASILFLATLPLLAIGALLTLLTSPGPIWFRHARVGKRGREITVLKLRTMTCTNVSGPGVTRTGDRRITPVGQLLRKTKIDELPQLINVLRGDMSMVGPRPDLAKYLDRVSPGERAVLLLSPGITSPTTLMLRNEERLLAAVPENELEDVYTTLILPQKIRLELEYARKASFTTDLQVLLRTAGAILFPADDSALTVTTNLK